MRREDERRRGGRRREEERRRGGERRGEVRRGVMSVDIFFCVDSP